MKIGLVGYGMGGRIFHAPFINAGGGGRGACRSRRAGSRQDRAHPGGAAGDRHLLEPVRDDCGGWHRCRDHQVVADKPFAPDADGGRDLDRAAKAKGVVLGVFHNRRWDSDIQTLRKLIQGDRLGRLWRLHSRMDIDDPATLDPGPTGGLLRDLGSHLVDQMA